MTRDGNRPLLWVQRNHRPKDRTVPAGACVKRWVGAVLDGGGVTAAPAVVAVIAGVVDEEFNSHCRVAVSDRGVVTINVDSPVLVDVIRRRWAVPLQAILANVKTVPRITRTEYRFGCDGLMLTANDTGRDQ